MKPAKFDATILTLGFAFLYIPILILVIYSFNESKLVTVWGGFSLKWYGEMWRNAGLMSAAWVTLQVGLLSATPSLRKTLSISTPMFRRSASR